MEGRGRWGEGPACARCGWETGGCGAAECLRG